MSLPFKDTEQLFGEEVQTIILRTEEGEAGPQAAYETELASVTGSTLLPCDQNF